MFPVSTTLNSESQEPLAYDCSGCLSFSERFKCQGEWPGDWSPQHSLLTTVVLQQPLSIQTHQDCPIEMHLENSVRANSIGNTIHKQILRTLGVRSSKPEIAGSIPVTTERCLPRGVPRHGQGARPVGDNWSHPHKDSGYFRRKKLNKLVYIHKKIRY